MLHASCPMRLKDLKTKRLKDLNNKPETRNPKHSKPATRNPKPETRNPKPATRNIANTQP